MWGGRMKPPLKVEELLTPGEAAKLLGVARETVTRYARDGLLPCRRTLGGHRRIVASAVYEILATPGDPVPPAPGRAPGARPAKRLSPEDAALADVVRVLGGPGR